MCRNYQVAGISGQQAGCICALPHGMGAGHCARPGNNQRVSQSGCLSSLFPDFPTALVLCFKTCTPTTKQTILIHTITPQAPHHPPRHKPASLSASDKIIMDSSWRDVFDLPTMLLSAYMGVSERRKWSVCSFSPPMRPEVVMKWSRLSTHRLKPRHCAIRLRMRGGKPWPSPWGRLVRMGFLVAPLMGLAGKSFAVLDPNQTTTCNCNRSDCTP